MNIGTSIEDLYKAQKSKSIKSVLKNQIMPRDDKENNSFISNIAGNVPDGDSFISQKGRRILFEDKSISFDMVKVSDIINKVLIYNPKMID